MHAIRQYEFGPAENLRYEQVDDPQPGEGQVRIKVEAAGVHLLDTSIRSGASGGPFGLPDLPMTPGREVAGVVDAIGPGVPDDWRGARVVAHLGPGGSGGYAELTIAKAVSLHRLPDSVPAATAVAMIGTGRTAMGILEVAELRPDDVVLVTAAAGGLGSLFVQEANHLGATAVGVAGGAAKVAKVRELGASVAVDSTEPDWPGRVREALGDRGITVALDGVGGELGKAAFDLLEPGGRFVMFGWSSGESVPLTSEDLFRTGATVSAAVGARMQRRMRSPEGIRPLEEQALAAVAGGRWAEVVTTAFPLESAADAHRELENRATTGKVVLTP